MIIRGKCPGHSTLAAEGIFRIAYWQAKSAHDEALLLMLYAIRPMYTILVKSVTGN